MALLQFFLPGQGDEIYTTIVQLLETGACGQSAKQLLQAIYNRRYALSRTQVVKKK